MQHLIFNLNWSQAKMWLNYPMILTYRIHFEQFTIGYAQNLKNFVVSTKCYRYSEFNFNGNYLDWNSLRMLHFTNYFDLQMRNDSNKNVCFSHYFLLIAHCFQIPSSFTSFSVNYMASIWKFKWTAVYL